MSMAIVCMVKEENTNNTDENTTVSPDELKCGTLEDGPTYDVS